MKKEVKYKTRRAVVRGGGEVAPVAKIWLILPAYSGSTLQYCYNETLCHQILESGLMRTKNGAKHLRT